MRHKRCRSHRRQRERAWAAFKESHVKDTAAAVDDLSATVAPGGVFAMPRDSRYLAYLSAVQSLGWTINRDVDALFAITATRPLGK